MEKAGLEVETGLGEPDGAWLVLEELGFLPATFALEALLLQVASLGCDRIVLADLDRFQLTLGLHLRCRTGKETEEIEDALGQLHGNSFS